MSNSDPQLIESFQGHRGPITSVDISARHVVSSSEDSSIQVWHIDSTQRPYRFIGHKGAVYDVAFSPAGDQIISGSKDECIKLWKLSQEGKSTTWRAHAGGVRTVAFSPDGRLLLSGSEDKSVKIWSAANNSFQLSFTGHLNWVRSARFSHDSRMVLSTGDDHTVRVWDLQAATGIQQFNLSVPVFNARFHPFGTCFAAGTGDSKAKLWDLRSQRVLQVHSGHSDVVTGVDFHPNGNFLISSSKDSSVKIWDLRQGHCLYTLLGHQGQANCVRFGKNGESFVSGGGDSSVLLWKAHAVNKDFSKKKPVKEEVGKSERVSEQLAGTLDKLVSQLDIVTRTIVMLDSRISNFEENISRLTERIMSDE